MFMKRGDCDEHRFGFFSCDLVRFSLINLNWIRLQVILKIYKYADLPKLQNNITENICNTLRNGKKMQLTMELTEKMAPMIGFITLVFWNK